ASANPSGLYQDDVFGIVRCPRGRWKPQQPMSYPTDWTTAQLHLHGRGDDRRPRECELGPDQRSSATSFFLRNSHRPPRLGDVPYAMDAGIRRSISVPAPT